MTRYDHVLAAIDLSLASERVLAEAVAVAAATGAAVSAVHVTPALLDSEARDHLRDVLAGLARRAAARHALSIGTAVAEGNPVAEILAAATARGADLIVVGRHDHNLFDRLLLESVAHEITRRAPCSVLALPPGTEPGRTQAPAVSNVLCAVDLSASSGQTVTEACALAAAAHARLTVLHVIDPSRVMIPAHTPGESAEIAVSAATAEAYERLATLLSRSYIDGLDADTLVAFGGAANQIVGAASVVGAQLILVGAPLRRRLHRPVLGATVRELLRISPRPVLLARGHAALESRRERAPTDQLLAIP